MKVSTVESNESIRRYHEVLERQRLDEIAFRRKEEIRQVDQRREEEKVQRARRLGLDKGQNVDISV
jgi:hypothetical protein